MRLGVAESARQEINFNCKVHGGKMPFVMSFADPWAVNVVKVEDENSETCDCDCRQRSKDRRDVAQQCALTGQQTAVWVVRHVGAQLTVLATNSNVSNSGLCKEASTEPRKVTIVADH